MSEDMKNEALEPEEQAQPVEETAKELPDEVPAPAEPEETPAPEESESAPAEPEETPAPEESEPAPAEPEETPQEYAARLRKEEEAKANTTKKLPLGALIGIVAGAVAAIVLVILLATGVLGGKNDEHTCTAGKWIVDTPATCTAPGSQHKECTVCHKTLKTESIPAGHKWDKSAVTCTSGRECTVCHATEEKLAHTYEKTGETAADCENAATVTYACRVCSDSYTEKVGAPLGHSTAGVTPTEVKKGDTCEYELHYICGRCEQDVVNGTVYHHTYTASIETEPTCTADGTRKLTCTCGETLTETIGKSDLYHKWIAGTPDGSRRTDTCEHCSATKTVIDASAETTAEVSSSDLKEVGEIQLQNGSIAFDEATKAGLPDGDLTVSSDKLEDAALESAKSALTPEQLEQLGESPIYDFSVKAGDEQIAFGGKVTVTLPYTLGEGEDSDNIAIWYLSEGEPVAIRATYANGFVTFETEHFSYYTVTRLTPAERCALYGHVYQTSTVEGNCLADSVEIGICTRCHDMVRTVTKPAPGHKYNMTETPATCAENGKRVYTCEACTFSYTEKLIAQGHDYEWVTDKTATKTATGLMHEECTKCHAKRNENTVIAALTCDHAEKKKIAQVDPICNTAGKKAYWYCAGCEKNYADEACQNVIADLASYGILPMLTHDYEWVTDKAATKAEAGLKHEECVHCHDKKNENTVIEMLTCDHTGAQKTEQLDPTCAVAGKKAYWTCPDCGKNFSDEACQNVIADLSTYGILPLAAHDFEETYTTDVPSTCQQAGTESRHCKNCDARTDERELPLVPHTYADGICEVCGAAEPDCTHELTKIVKKDLNAEYDLCPGWTMIYLTCECGQNQRFIMEIFGPQCHLGQSTEEWTDEEGIQHASTTCPDCGVCIEMIQIEEKVGCRETMGAEYHCSLDGEEIASFVYSMSDYSHTETEQSYDLGEHGACAGSLCLLVCEDCGKIIDMDQDECDLSCRMEDVTEEYMANWTVVTNGEFAGCYLDENGIIHSGDLEVYRCSVCGLTVVYEDEYAVPVEGLSCLYLAYEKTSLYLGDELLLSFFGDGNEEGRWGAAHDYEYTFTKYGATCDDGYDVHATCRACGSTYSVSKNSGHFTEPETVSLAEYGITGASISVSRCQICGNTRFRRIEGDYTEIKVDRFTEYHFPENGNVVLREIETSEGCVTYYGKYLSLVVNGETVDTYESNNYSSSGSHRYGNPTYSLKGATCDDGVTVTRACLSCGHVDTETRYWCDYEWISEDLSGHGACGGKIERKVCQICNSRPEESSDDTNNLKVDATDCHFETKSTETYTDGQGREHTVTVSVCSDCGLRVEKDSYRDYCYESRCEYDLNTTVLYSIGDFSVTDYISRYSEEHDYEMTVTFNDGIKDCENGYTVRYVCSICNDKRSNSGKWHDPYTIIVKEIDLAPYGCVCGGTLLLTSCACGKQTSYEFNTNCDMPPYAEDGVYRCAVTDPRCSFCYCEEWADVSLNENCPCMTNEARYITLGYGSQNERKVLVYVSSHSEMHHDQVYTDSGWKCRNCEAYYSNDIDGTSRIETTCEYDPEYGGYVTTQITFGGDTEMPDQFLAHANGTSQDVKCATTEREVTYPDGTVKNIFISEERGMFAYSDGEFLDWSRLTIVDEEGTYIHEQALCPREYWDWGGMYQDRKDIEFYFWSNFSYDYISRPDGTTELQINTFDFENCKRTYEAYENGELVKTKISDMHHYESEVLRESTCTQDRIVRFTCSQCGDFYERNEHPDYYRDSTHWFSYNKGKQCYVCLKCRLESINGVSGSIILEELHFGDDRYTVGYYNRGTKYGEDVEFTTYVALIIGDEEIVLQNITIHDLEDGYRGYWILKSDVAALAAELGYTEWDGVRFSFVPYDDDYDLDYAITFTENE